MIRSSRFSIWVAGVLALVGWTHSAAADEFMHGRISFADGGGLIKGVSDDDWSYATVNTLVLPNDTVWADQEGSVEIEMPGGTFVRMADGSKAEFLEMSPSLLVRGWTGSFYMQRVSRSSGDVFFDTPAARVNVDGNSQVRVDVVGEGSTTVSVRWGRAIVTVTGQPTPVVVSEGQRVYVDPGMLPSAVVPFDRTAEDAFDVWNRERAKLLAVGYSSVPAQISEKVIGVSDLNNYGEWVYIDSQPYWRPTVVTEYVPYRAGHWSYVPTMGYSWVGHYPFSYITSHYGRWTYHNSYGWCWGYRPGWSGAWVASVRYGSNFVWAPVGFDGYPVYYGGAHFSVGGVRFGMYSSSYCGVNDLFLGPTSVFAARPTIFSGVNQTNIFIWNINTNANRIGRDILPNTNLRVRDYSPRRVIRGPDIAGPRSVAASTRIASLESSAPRASFDRTVRAASAGRDVRTPIASSNRSAEVRTARVRESDLQQTRDTVRRVMRQDQETDTITGRGSAGGRSIRAAATEPGAVRDATGATGTSRAGLRDVTGAEGRTSRTARVPGQDGAPSAGSSRVPASATTRTATPDDAGSVAGVRTPSRSGVTSIGRDGSGVDTGRASRSRATTDSVRQTPVPGAESASPRSGRVDRGSERTAVPDRGVTAPTQRSTTPAPSSRVDRGSTRTTVPDRSVTAPAQRSTTPAPSSRVDRSSERTAVPQRSVTAPTQRSTTPAPSTRTPSSAPQRTPSVSTPSGRGSRDQSRISTPAPSAQPRQSVSRQTTVIPSSPSTRSVAPSRSSRTIAPQAPAPRATAPSSPSRSSTPSYSPPSRSNAPSYSPPSRSIQRSAPSVPSTRSSSPSFSTRSSGSSSPSFSAPSRGSRSVGAAPSRGSAPSSRGGGRSR